MNVLTLIAIKTMFIACIALIVTALSGAAVVAPRKHPMVDESLKLLLAVEGVVMCVAAIFAMCFAIWGL